jgi:hypothetical protein
MLVAASLSSKIIALRGDFFIDNYDESHYSHNVIKREMKMLYVKMIAANLNIDLELARKVFDNTFVPEGFSNASEETIMFYAKLAYDRIEKYGK